jgi:hypothetical protein
MRVTMLGVAVLGAVLGAALGCSDATPPLPKTIPYTPPTSTPPIQPKPSAPEPWLGCSPIQQQVYNEAGSIYNYGGITSQYTLCADGRFNLRIENASLDQFDAPGTYAQSDSIVAFKFDATGAWTATGKLRGDLMIVEYNDVMIGADFANGTYVRQAPP